MKKGISIIIVLFILLIMFGLMKTAMMLTNKSTSNNKTNIRTESTQTNLFYEYSDTNNIFSWNLYNGENAAFDSAKSGYLYYIWNKENENNKKNQLLINMSDFYIWFHNDIYYSDCASSGKAIEKKLDLKTDLRNKWSKNNINYPVSDITNKYNIERKVTLSSSSEEQYAPTTYYSAYMDIYVNSNNKVVYARPKDISTISYVTKDEVNTDAVSASKTMLESNNKSNVNDIIDSLGEPNYAVITNNHEGTKLTYVWYIFDNHYFYYTMNVRYYHESMLPGDDKIKNPLTGRSISNFEYGIVNKDYIYYTNNELARLFDAKEKKYNTATWISTGE